MLIKISKLKQIVYTSFILILPYLFSQLNAHWKVTGKNGENFILSPCKENLDSERKVFNKAFRQAFQDTEIEKMILEKYGNFAHYLLIAFRREQNDFDSHKPQTLFISAKNDAGDVAGYISFEKNTDYVYVRQLVVDPDYQKIGLAKLLIFSFLNIWKDCTCIKLLTRKLNSTAIAVYTQLGFTASSFTGNSCDTNIFTGFERAIDSNCAESLLKNYTLVSPVL